MSCSCHDGSCKAEAGARARLESRVLAFRFALSAVLFALALGLSFAPGGGWGPVAAKVLFVVSWVISGYRVAINAARSLGRKFSFDENFLMTAATLGAFAIGQWSEGAAVMLFYNLGELVQESAVSKSRRSIVELLDVRPETARLAGGGGAPAESGGPAENGRLVSARTVVPGTLIRVLAGERVPLDGVVEEGFTSFDTASITGESLPRDAKPGDLVFAGFVNGHGAVTVRTTVAFADTAASRMLKLIEESRDRKARAERFITSFARVYTPVVTLGALALAFAVPLAILVFSGGFSPSAPFASIAAAFPLFASWIYRGLVFLVISCPCAFVISVPLGYFGGIGGAAKKGILVKGADILDSLSRVKTVVFDKTGTLTSGSFSVVAVEVAPGRSEEEVALLLAAAETHATHPLGVAIREWKAVQPSAELSDYSELSGYGVSCRYGSDRLLAGSRAWLERNGALGGVAEPGPGNEGSSSIELAVNGVWAGRALLADEVKPGSAAAVTALASLGVDRVAMVSGDTLGATSRAAVRLGIREFRAGSLPHEKVGIFERIRGETVDAHPKGTTVFVGDGINDAAVLARADVGIAMGALGSDAAIEAADAVLMNDDPALVATAIAVAKRTRRIVTENIALAFAVKIGFLALGAAGTATLWEAVFADVGVALLATLNSVRARR